MGSTKSFRFIGLSLKKIPLFIDYPINNKNKNNNNNNNTNNSLLIVEKHISCICIKLFSPVGDTALLTAGLPGQVQGAGAVVSQVQGEQGQVSGVVRVETNRQGLRFNYSSRGSSPYL